MEVVRTRGEKASKNTTDSKTGKFFELVNQTQCMTNGLSSSIKSQVFKNIEEVGKLKKLDASEIENLKFAVTTRAQKSEALLQTRVQKSLELATTQLSKALSKEMARVEKSVLRLDKKLSKLEKTK